MEKIVEALLNAVRGVDLAITVVALVSAFVWCRFIVATKTRERKILRRQILAVLIVALFAIGAILIHHRFSLADRSFPADTMGILVLRIAGDDQNNSLQASLVARLNAELPHIDVTQRIETHAGKSLVSEDDGLEAAHAQAREIGQRLGARLVIWGRRIGADRFYLRITISLPNNSFQETKRTHGMVTITEFSLPQDVVDEPFYILHFAAGLSYFDDDRYEEALTFFKAALARKGATPQELADLEFVSGLSHCFLAMRQADHQEALRQAQDLYQSAARAYEGVSAIKGALAYYSLGLSYQTFAAPARDRDLPKAIPALDRAIQLNPQRMMFYITRGSVYEELGDTARALSDFTAVIRFPPKDAESYYSRGVAYQHMRTLDKAIADFTESIRLEPNTYVYLERGDAHADKHEYALAIQDYAEALRRDPSNVGAYIGRSDAYEATGDYQKAMEDIEQAIRLKPNEAAAYNSRGILYAGKDEHERAISDYSYAITLDITCSAAYLNRSLAYKTNGSYEKALADADQAIRFKPASDAYANRGDIYVGLNNYEKALADYNESLCLNPQNSAAYTNRGRLHHISREFSAAIVDYVAAIRLDPDSYQAHGNIARILATCPNAKLRDGNGAIAYAIRACELSKWNQPNLLDTLAAAYAEAGNFVEAAKWQHTYLATTALEKESIKAGEKRLRLYERRQPLREGG